MDPTKQEEPILNIIQIVEKNPLLNIRIEDYNSLNKFIKIATIVLRFLIKRIPKLATRLPEAINQPRTLILQWYLQWEQKEHYADVFNALETQKFHLIIKKFRLVTDQHNLLHCCGRFEFRPVPDTIKYPILLPSSKTSHLTKLIIAQAHENNFHTGTNHTLTTIWKQYWIPCGHAAVYNVIRKCNSCERYTTRPYSQPQESNLPEFRLTPHQ